MAGYTKLFSSILDSTVWDLDAETRIVWITMLAMADRDGLVEASLPGLARRAGIPIAATEQALAVFQSPDKYSRTPDNEGRRVEPADGGWLLLNYAKYREKANRDEVREKAAERQRRKRKRDAEKKAASRPSPDVTNVTQSNDIAEAEAPSEAEAGGGTRAGASTSTTNELSENEDRAERQHLAAKVAYVNASGGTWQGDGRKFFGPVGAMASEISQRTGVETADICAEWARRYFHEYEKRRPEWWLEKVERWASEAVGKAAPDPDLPEWKPLDHNQLHDIGYAKETAAEDAWQAAHPDKEFTDEALQGFERVRHQAQQDAIAAHEKTRPALRSVS